MSDDIKDGFSEVTATVKRTIQIHQFEPLTVMGSIKRIVPNEDSYEEFGRMCVKLEEEIMEFLGITD